MPRPLFQHKQTHADIHIVLEDNVKRSLEIIFPKKNEILVFDFRSIEKELTVKFEQKRCSVCVTNARDKRLSKQAETKHF